MGGWLAARDGPFTLSSGVLPVGQMLPPHTARGQSASLRTACLKALIDADVADEQAKAVVEALPKRWEKLGDVVLFAPCAFFNSAHESASLHILQVALLEAPIE